MIDQSYPLNILFAPPIRKSLADPGGIPKNPDLVVCWIPPLPG